MTVTGNNEISLMTCKSTATDMAVRIFDVRFEKQKMSCRQPKWSTATLQYNITDITNSTLQAANT